MNANIVKTQIFYFMMYGLRGHWRHFFHFFFNILFVWYLILSKFGMNAKMIQTQIFHNIKLDLKGHWRSLLILWKEIMIFHRFVKRLKLLLYRCNFFINEVRPQRSLKLTKGHLFLRYIFCVLNLILSKVGINANITNIQILMIWSLTLK